MRVAQVISSMGQESSGVQAYLLAACNALAEANAETVLYTCGNVREMRHGFPIKTYPVRAFPVRSLARSPELKRALSEDCAKFDVVQSNGLWQLPNVYAAQAVHGHRAKLVTMPHGTLSRWALSRSRWKKWLFGLAGQRAALARTDMFIATCEKEANEIRECGYRQPVAVIPIGFNVSAISPKDEAKHSKRNIRRVGFLGRLHRVKGVDNLIEAWAEASHSMHGMEASDWELAIAGPDGGMRSELEARIAREGIPNVRFVGELHGEEKYVFLRDADIAVLPSHTENFGITVAESLACETPAIASKGTPWDGLPEERCGWWVDIGARPLAQALQEAMALTDGERLAMGRRGRNWLEREFTWKSVAQKMLNAYSWLVHGGVSPACVV